MRKVLLFLGISVAVILGAVQIVFAQDADYSINLTSPNGGEVWKAGETHAITWEQRNIDTVYLGWSTGPGSLAWIEIAIHVDPLATTGTYNWKIPDFINQSGVQRFKIDITGYKTGVGSRSDQSDDYFEIQPLAPPQVTSVPQSSGQSQSQLIPTDSRLPSTLTLTSPNGRETFTTGGSATITWDQSNVNEVELQYRTYQGLFLPIATVRTNPAALTGSYTWNVPAHQCVLADDYIKVMISGGGARDESNDYAILKFAPTNPTKPKVTIGAMNGEANYYLGDTVNVSFDHRDVANVRFGIINDAYVSRLEIAGDIFQTYDQYKNIILFDKDVGLGQARENFTWKIPADFKEGPYRTVLIGTNFECGYGHTAALDIGDVPFFIKQKPIAEKSPEVILVPVPEVQKKEEVINNVQEKPRSVQQSKSAKRTLQRLLYRIEKAKALKKAQKAKVKAKK